MTKQKVLGVINLLLAIFFFFILVTSSYSGEPLVSLKSFIQAYMSTGILVILFLVNTLLAYKINAGKTKKLPFFLYLILTVSTIFWLLLLFAGFFFATSIVFPIISLILVFSIFYLLRKFSTKLVLVLSLFTLLVSIVAIASSFEENYCWDKGTKADPTGTKMAIANREDVKDLKGFDVKEGSEIGVAFRTHMLCHNTFDLVTAIKEKYF